MINLILDVLLVAANIATLISVIRHKAEKEGGQNADGQ